MCSDHTPAACNDYVIEWSIKMEYLIAIAISVILAIIIVAQGIIIHDEARKGNLITAIIFTISEILWLWAVAKLWHAVLRL